jgi:hypothetical protein
VTIRQVTTRAGGTLATMAHEAGCGPSKSPGQGHVCVNCNGVENLPYL